VGAAATVSGTNGYATSSGGTKTVVASTESDLGSGGSFFANGAVAGLQTTDASFHDIMTFAPAANTTHRYSVTVVGRRSTNNGDSYSADFVFMVDVAGNTLNPSTPSTINPISNGGGSSYSAQVTWTGGNVHVQVQGAAATTVNWTAAIQDVGRS
jgi:hypothetical protein